MTAPVEQDRLPGLAESWRRIRLLAAFVRPHRALFWLAVVTSLTGTLCGLAVPFLFKQAIDRGIATGKLEAVYALVGAAVVAIVGSWAMVVLSTRASMWGFRTVNDLRVALFKHVQQQGLDFFHVQRTGVVISRLTNDIDALENLVSDGVFMVFVSMATLCGIEAFLFSMDWRLALATNAILPLMITATVLFRTHSGRAYRVVRERMGLVTAFLAERLGGMRVLQAFAAEERSMREFHEVHEQYRRVNMTTVRLNAAYFPALDFLKTVGTAIVLLYGGWLTGHDALTFGVLFAFITYLNDFFDPIQQLSQFYGSFLSAMAALEKIVNMLEIEPTVKNPPDGIRPTSMRGHVRFNGVSFRYADESPEVLHDVNLDIAPGETVALVGHTGAGKSTIVRLLARFWDPSEGSITIDGIDLREFDLPSLRRQLGIVPQEGFLFSGTIADNIRFGNPDASDEDVRAAAEAAGAAEFIDSLEDGWNTSVGERGGRLSAGQRQLVSFARALLMNPAMLVLDEATSSVDVATEQRMNEGLRRLVQGRTAFIVAHRLSTIRDADRILVVDDGRVVEQGSHEELLAAGGRYAQLYGSWRGGQRTIEQCLDDVIEDRTPAGPSGG